MQNQPVRVTPSRPSAMLGSRPRTVPSHPRCVMRGVRCRELGAARVSARTALESLVCDPLRSVIEIGAPHEEQIVPPFALHFCPNERAQHVLLAADEDGGLTILDSRRSAQEQPPETRTFWRAHNNAIFDAAWVPQRDEVLTASGDQSCALWDVATEMRLASFRGHRGSVKAVSCRPGEPHLFASGARDGSVLLWDRRTGETPVAAIADAHAPAPQPGVAAKRKRSQQPHSVSALVHLRDDCHGLATAGASDGTVKLWDCRALAAPSSSPAGARGKARVKPPVSTLQPTASRGNRPHGIASLALDPRDGRLAVSSTDHTLYLYDTRWCVRAGAGARRDAAVPDVGQFRGHLCDSFYVKACFSPDGRYVLHGSSDRCAYIWETDRPDLPPLTLRGHDGEVTGVAWCPADLCKVATASDDQTVRVWTVDREAGRPASPATAPRPHAPSSRAAGPSAETLARPDRAASGSVEPTTAPGPLAGAGASEPLATPVPMRSMPSAEALRRTTISQYFTPAPASSAQGAGSSTQDAASSAQGAAPSTQDAASSSAPGRGRGKRRSASPS